MSLPTKLEQALNYKWHPGNVDTLHRLMMERILEIDRKFSEQSGPVLSKDDADMLSQLGMLPRDTIPEPKNKHADKIADKSWRDYDSEPDGLEA